ncbi:Protein of unknown function (DUF1685 [Striga hermonthica]|uniref:Uncharacterized protein n=1 Tax=Striga hermonthica TaxID=68872 RepID=A0A9N7MTZ5_STRHE|nr:Protein of unknown function (DUF1685 [Striga hermonthica]
MHNLLYFQDSRDAPPPEKGQPLPRATELRRRVRPPSMSPHPKHPPPHAAAPLRKQSSWSPDSHRDEAWLRQKADRRVRRSRSVTDEDLDELRACIELGFGFDSPEMDQRLNDAFPAYSLYYAVNKQYHDAVAKPPPSPSAARLEPDAVNPIGSPHAFIGPGENPERVKTRLRHWAQVVACAVRQSST